MPELQRGQVAQKRIVSPDVEHLNSPGAWWQLNLFEPCPGQPYETLSASVLPSLGAARYLLRVTPALKYDRGTLVMREVPEVVQHLFTWDARSQVFRARGQAYREISELLRGHLVVY